jgi:hypothetical protein
MTLFSFSSRKFAPMVLATARRPHRRRRLCRSKRPLFFCERDWVLFLRGPLFSEYLQWVCTRHREGESLKETSSNWPVVCTSVGVG